MGHSKGKWSNIESATGEPNARAIVNEEGIYIADCYSLGSDCCQAEPEETQANAERIVKCVNNHDELVEALEGLLRHCESDEYMRPHQYRRIQQAQKLINKVRGV